MENINLTEYSGGMSQLSIDITELDFSLMRELFDRIGDVLRSKASKLDQDEEKGPKNLKDIAVIRLTEAGICMQDAEKKLLYAAAAIRQIK